MVFRQVVTKVRNGGRHRDVGTQIRYLGDGNNLSLMELDILRHTGCTWSKIIYPGFKGNSKPFADQFELMKSADKFEKDGIQQPLPYFNHLSPGNLRMQFVNTLAESRSNE